MTELPHVVDDDEYEPRRSFRCSDELWNAAKTKCEHEDVTLSQVLRQALDDFVNERTT